MKTPHCVALLALAAMAFSSCRGAPYVQGSASSGGFSVSGGLGAPPPTTVDYGATEAALDGDITKLTEGLASITDPELADKILAGLTFLLEQKESIARLVEGAKEQA